MNDAQLTNSLAQLFFVVAAGSQSLDTEWLWLLLQSFKEFHHLSYHYTILVEAYLPTTSLFSASFYPICHILRRRKRSYFQAACSRPRQTSVRVPSANVSSGALITSRSLTDVSWLVNAFRTYHMWHQRSDLERHWTQAHFYNMVGPKLVNFCHISALWWLDMRWLSTHRHIF